MREEKCETSLKTRERLAIKVFHRTAQYDRAIAGFLNQAQETESSFSLDLPLYANLRYGDNPHQDARLYGNFADCFSKLQGKELSYTNILDIEAAADLILDFRRPTVAILKHTNPCGVGLEGLLPSIAQVFIGVGAADATGVRVLQDRDRRAAERG